MEVVNQKIEEYAQQHSSNSSNLVDEIYDWTVGNCEGSRMLSGQFQVSILRLLARSINAIRILEIGMFTGYSALAMAEVLPDDGELITIDIEPKRKQIAQSFFDRSPHKNKLKIVIDDALNVIPSLDGNFSMVYIDADKSNYINYYEAAMPLVSSGGLIVADNVLWSGEVLSPNSVDARALDDFNRRVQADSRVVNTLLTVRDGLMVIHKL